jgi:S-DNA-T family DNA segregation ATPase FtsK/SpoIIIE
LSLYDGIPHLLYPVVKDVRQAPGVLRWALKEMDRRYNLLVEVGARNIDSYNKKRAEDARKLPYILVVIDELADLMMQQGPEVEGSICRLAQLARAVGIHLIIATQRPSVDVITGTIKANISSRIAFAVASGVDSKTILDQTGAERLVGRGDMLFLPIDAPKAVRIQGAYIGETEIEALVDHLKAQGSPDYEAEVVTVDGPGMGKDTESDDELFEQAVRTVVTTGHASTSMLQRKFNIGYGRAARLIDMMESKGIVGPMNNAKPRDILMPKEAIDQLFSGVGKAEAMNFDEDE